MAEETKTYVFGQDNMSLATLLSQRGIDANTLALLNNNGFGGNNFLWIIFLFFLMGWGGNGFGMGGNNGTGFLANQLNNTAGRDLLLQAIQGNGNAIGQLASNLNVDLTAVQSALTGLASATQAVGAKTDLTGAQVMSAIQNGDAALSRQLCECCCENRLLTTQQGYEAQIRTLEQTNQLSSQADKNTRSITDAIAAQTATMLDQFCQVKERELQDKIDLLSSQNTVLRGQIDNANQTAAITGYINSIIAPIQADVNKIRESQPSTVSVQWPNLVAVNNTPYMGYYAGFNGYGYGNYGSSYWG